MSFNDEPKDFAPLDPEELNSLIDAWGKELFKQEIGCQRDSGYLCESGQPTPLPTVTRHSFAFIRTWKLFGHRHAVTKAA